MNQASRTPLFAFALAASLAAPLAFAAPPAATTGAGVSATAATAATPATPATPQTDTTAATSATPATPATPAAQASASANGKLSWNDLDGDKNGNLSKTEAQTVPALVALFDKADANTDGQLSGDEYRAYVSKSQGTGMDQGSTSGDASTSTDAGTSGDTGTTGDDDGGKK